MPRDQIVIGVVTAALCVLGVWQSRWFLTNSKIGRWFARRFGESRGLWVVRGLFLAGAVFGVLLATDVVRPIRW
ncbi:MAG: hypothetical protein ACREJB_18920 [Planctomycetaceae bacterium]